MASVAAPPPRSSFFSLASHLYSVAALKPRRVIHSLKVGLALSLVSLTVLQQDLFNRLGNNAIWAVLTVVVVFELTTGATLCKGSNRAFGTLLAGTLALGVEYLADLAGPEGEAYVVGVSVFLVGTLATFLRFCEPFKSRYDYGVMIFLLTFSLVMVSGYRMSNNLDLAISRLLTILLGGAACLLVSMLVWPIWAGEDLHNIVCNNFDNLGGALEDCVKAYFKRPMCYKQVCEEDSVYNRYKAVLATKPSEESLANFASWEPRWRRLGGKKAWKQYVNVGGMVRNCTHTVASLHGCLNSEVQAPMFLREDFAHPCLKIAQESSALLKELGEYIRRRDKGRPKEQLMRLLLHKVEKLKMYINACPHLFVNPQEWALKRTTTLEREDKMQQMEKSFACSGPARDSKLGSFAEADGVTTSCEDQNPSERVEAEIATGGFQSIKKSDENETAPVTDMSMTTSRQFTEFLSIATVAFLLIELVPRLEHLVDAVKALEEVAGFRSSKRRRPFVTVIDNSCYDSMVIQMVE